MKSEEMVPFDLTAILRELEEATLRELDERAKKRSGCVGVTRGRAIAFTWSRATQAEQAHVSGCDWCRRLIAKIRSTEHPAMAVLYAARADRLPAEDAVQVEGHTRDCKRCSLVAASSALFPQKWIEEVHRRLQSALDRTFVVPAAVGLHSTASRLRNQHQVIESGDWTVTVEREGQKLRVAVNRRADGEDHARARVVLVGPEQAVHMDVALRPSGAWWTGIAHVGNPWAAAVDATELSVIVTEV